MHVLLILENRCQQFVLFSLKEIGNKQCEMVGHEIKAPFPPPFRRVTQMRMFVYMVFHVESRNIGIKGLLNGIRL